MRLREFAEPELPDYIQEFLPHVQRELKLHELPKIELCRRLPGDSTQSSFGMYKTDENCIYLVAVDRNPVDILRTLAHELTHYKQDQQGLLDQDSGHTGSRAENDANAQAGIIMRNYGKRHKF
jgi:Zn-dependent peptidase ImmA (M78 family)